ncbi:GFA family protein [uncultured Cohaesibacter sp.]|uniref:GFA family protein n=1 Tax=uncultured Cohaesibacter sp. TaxID=1002546 RepID=UPI002AA7DED6|nr:GFA family protein [uncultured Cohaesibacter sp.]
MPFVRRLDLIKPGHTYNAACHCGSVQFRVTISDNDKPPRRCTCSLCRMRGAAAVSAPLDGIEFLKGEDMLTKYQFGTMTAEHYFCSKCGIYTHHKRRSNPNEYGVNVACFEGVSPFDFEEIVVFDGVNHPKDSDGASNIAGYLRFTKE